MKMIVGLGNVGERYEGTPHNVGFMVLDVLVEKAVSVKRQASRDKMRAEVWKGELEGEEVLLVWPTTMMNLSGEAVSRVAQFYKVAPEDIWIVHDELDLPLGRVKIGRGGGNNGHNGLISISKSLGHSRYLRFKVGVDTRQDRQIPGLAYVLMKYPEEELDLLHRSVDMVAEAVKTCLKQGVMGGQEMYNKKTA